MKRIFPIYPKTSGSYVSQKRIDKLKQKAIEIISKNEQSITLAFRKLMSRYSKHVTMDLKLDVANRNISNRTDLPGQVSIDCHHQLGGYNIYLLWSLNQ